MTNNWWEKELGGYNGLGIAIIAIVLGSFGVHNFLMGETKKGIIKLVGTIFCGIVGPALAAYDWVRIVLDKYTVDANAFI